ncbi:Venom allergen 5 [Gryllus bimaculatus]|nr:Venom allergen 5 [Gryllus bimaculatus]
MLSVNVSSAGPRARCLAHRSCVRFNGLMDLNRIPSSTHGHDFHSGQSRVVMVRKTEQRTFASARNGEEPKFETVTRETVQTFSGSRSQKSTSEKRDVFKGLPQQLGAALEPQPAEDKKVTTSKGAEKPQGPSIPLFGKKSAKEEGSDGYSNFAEDCLAAHNVYRAKHDVPPLKLSKKMCQYSEEWAKRLATTGKLEHRPNNEFGENLFCVWSSDPNHKVTGREPVDNWYAEIKNHVFGKEPRDLKTGHFTQVVWKDSRTLGVGMARSRGGNTFVVANYDPPGNFIGNFATHVPPVGYAAEWAAVLARENRFAHRPESTYGENIYCHWSSDVEAASEIGAKDAIQAWYNEMKDFEFGSEPRSLKSGHFTQVIWKGSRKLGIGRARDGGRVLIVANYDPRGNFIGQFSANVPPPKRP